MLHKYCLVKVLVVGQLLYQRKQVVGQDLFELPVVTVLQFTSKVKGVISLVLYMEKECRDVFVLLLNSRCLSAVLVQCRRSGLLL